MFPEKPHLLVFRLASASRASTEVTPWTTMYLRFFCGWLALNGPMQMWAKLDTKRELQSISKTSSDAVRRESLRWDYLPPVPLPSIQQSAKNNAEGRR
jgi:hypothetical protein